MPPNWKFSHVKNPLNKYPSQRSSGLQGHSRRSSKIQDGSLFDPCSALVFVYPKFQPALHRSYLHAEEEKAYLLLRESVHDGKNPGSGTFYWVQTGLRETVHLPLAVVVASADC